MRLIVPLLLWVTQLQMSALGWAGSTASPDLFPELFYQEPSIALPSSSVIWGSPWVTRRCESGSYALQQLVGSTAPCWLPGTRVTNVPRGSSQVSELSCQGNQLPHVDNAFIVTFDWIPIRKPGEPPKQGLYFSSYSLNSFLPGCVIASCDMLPWDFWRKYKWRWDEVSV